MIWYKITIEHTVKPPQIKYHAFSSEPSSDELSRTLEDILDKTGGSRCSPMKVDVLSEDLRRQLLEDQLSTVGCMMADIQRAFELTDVELQGKVLSLLRSRLFRR